MTKEEAKEELQNYYSTTEELKEAIKNDEIQDAISEIADNIMMCLYADLFDWFRDNYYKVEDAIEEYGFPELDGKPDILMAIRQGQYKENEEVLYEALEEIKVRIETLKVF
jgi:hypothetical protein